MTRWLHLQRLDAVRAEIRHARAARVLDLGCGDGDLLVQLATDPAITHLVGIDICAPALERLRGRLAAQGASAGRIDLRCASMTEATPDLAGFDCALLVETIEHLDPAHLSRLERAVFGQMQPAMVVITTPNAEFNPLLGVPPHRFRHPGHRFEWSRARFRRWGQRVAAQWAYTVQFRDIAGTHPDLGGASQMAVFHKPPA